MTDATPIEEYGAIGNLETCALVGPDGSVDWFPYPHVESPTMFAAILDSDRGGRFRVGPADGTEGHQEYVGRTNVLETTFRTDDGTATLTDFMPPAGGTNGPTKVLYRKATCTDGRVELTATFAPRFDYGRAETTLEATDEGVLASGADEKAALSGPVSPADGDAATATGRVPLSAGETTWFVLRCTGAVDATTDPAGALSATLDYWAEWARTCDDEGADCVFDGPWHEQALRSGVVLKLLTHHDTGAIAAAPTASLPEEIGGVRNWDYRYNWLRDAAFTIQALSNLGHAGEAEAYFDWVMDLCDATDPDALQPLYTLHGDGDVPERELDHLDGYRDSRPVRIGNGAADQRQLDVYGELLLAVDEMVARGYGLGEADWATLRNIADYVAEVWTETDAGIWEVRGDPRHFVFSKVMCWVALDRAIALAEADGRDGPVEEWRETRAEVRAAVLERGYDADRESFVQSFGSDALDATGLLVPVVGFLPFGDDRVQGTIESVAAELATDDGLVYRYDGDDGLPGSEGTFVLCSCWLVDALALSGRVEAARDRFETLLEYAGPLGLFAEELDPESGGHLGNYPQAFSHIGLVNSAIYLGHVAGYGHPGPPPMGIRLGVPVD